MCLAEAEVVAVHISCVAPEMSLDREMAYQKCCVDNRIFSGVFIFWLCFWLQSM